LVSWNLHGVPGAPRRPERFAAAGQEILRRGPELVLLQEVWRDRQVDQLGQALQPAGYAQVPVPAGGWFGRKAGLLAWVHAASGWEISAAGFHEFASEAPDWKLWEGDGFGDKGVQHFVARRGDLTLQLLNTHLQAAYEPGGYAEIRAQQLRELHGLATRLADSHGDPPFPTILGGDLNTTPDEEAFAELAGWRDLTRKERRRCGCGTSVGAEPPEWLDYVMASLPEGLGVRAQLELIRSPAADDPFSDHQGLDVSLAFGKESSEGAETFRPSTGSDHEDPRSQAAAALAAVAGCRLLDPGSRRAFLQNGALLAVGLALGIPGVAADSDTIRS
jgi:endonuclease/exonuclease/phosphatase family metal-dependent hydrolase